MTRLMLWDVNNQKQAIRGSIQMKKDELLKKVAPCGLLCYTCTAAKDGAIQHHSQKLTALLEGFDRFAERFSDHESRSKNYPVFKDVLQMFSGAGCEGCRSGKCMYPGCQVSPCIMQKEIDFCFECGEFPCDKVDFDRSLKAMWIIATRRMRTVGVQAYYNENKDKSHYT